MNKEIAVISALYGDNDVSAFAQARPEMFATHGDVHAFILEYYSKNKALPPRGIVEDKFVISLATGEVGSTRHHLEELQNLSIQRELRSILRDSAEKLQDGRLVDALNGMINASSSLKSLSSEIHDVDITDLDAAVEHILKVQELNAKGGYGVKFGIPGIDDFLPSGMVPGMFGIILGYPGRGKSWLATLMAMRAWDRNKKVLYVSLEMVESEVRARMYAIAGDGKWSLRKLQSGNVDTDDLRSWGEKRFMDKPPFPVINNDSSGRFSPSDLRVKIDEYNPDIVFVDYLQLMSSTSGNDGNETVKLKNISTELKLLATSSATPIVGVASATPSDSTDIESVPELFQVAWSKQLAYDTDWMLAVGRADESPIMSVVWRKNRNGPLAEFILQCYFNEGRFIYSEMDFE